MNTRLSLVGLIGLALLGGCDWFSKPKPQDNEQEIEQRVQARLADEQRERQARELAEREQQLAAREKEIADREALLEQEREAQEAAAAQAAAQPEPEPAAEPVAEPVAQQAVGVNYEAPEVTPQTFYDDLAPHGEWMETPDYGYVFRPALVVTNVSWRPYEDGRWLYTDDGWAWASNEPFGWACYHYGRWTRLRGVGWVWVPGTEWAPAWVSWRMGDEFCGWAPLPPEAGFGGGGAIEFDVAGDLGALSFVFVPTANLCETSLRRHVVDRSRNVTIITRTRNVTRIVRKTVRNRTVIVNEGPAVAQVEAVSKRTVQRLTIERREGPQGAVAVQGNAVRFSAPARRQAAGLAKPHRVAQKITKVEVERDAVIAPSRPVQQHGLQAGPQAPQPAAVNLPVPANKPQPQQPAMQTPQEAQRQAIEQEQARQRHLIEQQRLQRERISAPSAPAQQPRPANEPAQPREIQRPANAQPQPDAQREVQQQQRAMEHQQRQRQLEIQQQRQQQAGQSREAAAARQEAAAQRARQQPAQPPEARQGNAARKQQTAEEIEEERRKRQR